MLPTLVLGRIMVTAGSAKMRVEAVFWLLRESEELLARGIFTSYQSEDSEPFQKVFQRQFKRNIKRFSRNKKNHGHRQSSHPSGHRATWGGELRGQL